MPTDRAADVFEVTVDLPGPWRRRLRGVIDLVSGAISLGAWTDGYRDTVTITGGDEIVRRWSFDVPELCEERAQELRRDLDGLSTTAFRDRWIDGVADD
ncbi:MAG: hypothetical protein AAGF02_17240 [Actinomycetota bacterium]